MQTLKNSYFKNIKCINLGCQRKRKRIDQRNTGSKKI